MNVRDLVYKSLLAIEKDEKYSNLELSASIAHYDLAGKDKSFYTALLYGVTERKITLDYWIEAFTKKKIARLDLAVVILLRMGIYQIVYLDKIPDRAAVDQTVTLGRRYASRALSFLNGVLRNVCREKENLPYPDPAKDRLGYLSVFYSIPRPICEIWERDYPDQFEELMKSMSEPAPVTLRVNTLKTTPDALRAEYPDLRPCAYSPFGLVSVTPIPLSDFAPLADGRCFVQDESSQLACMALDPRDGDLILDVCAAPGGKSLSAAIYTSDSADILSMDVHESKLSLIRSAAERLSIGRLRVTAHDSTRPIGEYTGKADRVICDVPCSGLGVLAKKSDLRNNGLKSLDELPEIQYNILASSAQYLKPGGILVYSTCTLHKKENEDIVGRFVGSHPDFELVPFSAGSLDAVDGMLTLFPCVHHTDGFFIAKIRRKTEPPA